MAIGNSDHMTLLNSYKVPEAFPRFWTDFPRGFEGGMLMKGGGDLGCSKHELVIKQLSLFIGCFDLNCLIRFSLNSSTRNIF